MAQNVYTYFDSSPDAPPNQCAMLRLWVRSWSARGWRPRILTVRNAARHPRFGTCGVLSALAAEAAKVKWTVPVEAINFGFTPRDYRKSGPPRLHHFHSVGWEHAPVVLFENVHDNEIVEHCGRPL